MKQDAGQPPPPPPPKQDSGTPPPPPKKDAAPPPPKKDAYVPPPPKPDTFVPPPKQDSGTPPTGTNWVAAIQYASGQAAQVKASCTSETYPDVCALKALVEKARKAPGKNATYIVLPEYAMDLGHFEPIPSVGDNPATSWSNPELAIRTFSIQAKQLAAYIILNLKTYKDAQTTCTTDADCPGSSVCSSSNNCIYVYNTSIAFDPTGQVKGVHKKFNLFGNEASYMTAGTSVTNSIFSTPLGKMGMLICADIYGSTTLNNQIGKARVVAVSSYWTTTDPINNYYKPYLGVYSYYAIIANTTDPPGQGGGVFAPPKMATIQTKVSTSPDIAYGLIPPPP